MKYAFLLLLLAACGGGASTDDIVFTPSAVFVGGVAHYPSISENLVLTSDGSFGIRCYVDGPITTIRVTEANHRATTFGAYLPYAGSWESHDDFAPGMLLVEAWGGGYHFLAAFDYEPGISESFALRLSSLNL